MSRPLAAALAKLLEGEGGQALPGPYPASGFTSSQRQALDDFARMTGAVALRLQGRGSVYQVLNAELLTHHLRTLQPKHADAIDTSLPRRAANIAQTRNSKGRAHGHELHYLLLKSISNGVVWQNQSRNGAQEFDLTQTTRVAGAGVLAIAEVDEWCSDQSLWLVENQALFDRLDWLPAGAAGSVVYYGGQMPGRLLNWLARRARATEVILFPDYDGVGLLNYARLLEVCCSPCRFWLMPGWRVLLETYGNNAVWQNTRGDFEGACARLRVAKVSPGVMELCAAMSKLGLALEHEAVWLGPPAT